VGQARQRNRFIKIGVSKASAKTVITVIPKAREEAVQSYEADVY